MRPSTSILYNSSNRAYAFGSAVKERTTSFTISYKFSMNTQEKEPELGEGVTSAEFWMYDGKLGRRWNVDPKCIVNYSPFACLNNNPIWFVDIKGDSVNVEGSEKRKRIFCKQLKKVTGHTFGVDKENNLFVKRFNSSAWKHPRKFSTDLMKLIENAIGDDGEVPIVLTRNSNDVLFDKFDDARVDIGDLAKCSRTMLAGQLGHIFSERLACKETMPIINFDILEKWVVVFDYGDVIKSSQETRDKYYNIAHNNYALQMESQIVCSLLNIPFELVTHEEQSNIVGTYNFWMVSRYGKYAFGYTSGSFENPSGSGMYFFNGEIKSRFKRIRYRY